MGEHLRAAASDEAEAASSGSSLSQVTADAGASALREAGLANLSPTAVAQIAQLLEVGGRAAKAAPATMGRAIAWVAATFLAFLLAVSVVAGVWIADQRVRAIEAKLADVDALKMRQDALVLHLLASVEQIAEAQGVDLPRVPAVLRIAEAQAAEAQAQ